ncbi:MAG: CvpA family protein [Bacteroidetes bacterium]|nr:CvpA family protein [Bacteroidota bacterium]
MADLVWLDWVFIGILGLGILTGGFKGFWTQVFSFAGLICGYFLAMKFGNQADVSLSAYLPGIKSISPFTGMILVFLGVYLVFKLAGSWVETSEWIGFSPVTNAILGGLLGGLKALVFILILDIAFSIFNWPDKEITQKSVVYPVVHQVTEEVSTRFNLEEAFRHFKLK